MMYSTICTLQMCCLIVIGLVLEQEPGNPALLAFQGPKCRCLVNEQPKIIHIFFIGNYVMYCKTTFHFSSIKILF